MGVAVTTNNADRRAQLRDAVIVAGIVLAFFANTFMQLAKLWRADANYSHGWLIPFFAAVPAWLHLKKNGIPLTGNRPLGLLYVFSGGVLHLIAQALVIPPLDFIAIFCVLRGLAIAIGGREWANGFTFAIVFLFFMFPIPHIWTSYVSLWLQDIVSRTSEMAIDPFVPCFRRGNSLYLAGVATPLTVAEECSGLRQIIAFVACGAFVAYFSGRTLPLKLLLVLAAVPVAIAANVLRIMMMAFGAKWFGTGWMSGTLHDAPALFSIPVGLGLYLLVGWALGMTRHREAPKGEAP